MSAIRVINTEQERLLFVQTASVEDALEEAATWLYVGSLFKDDPPSSRNACRKYAYAYLNRACELACVPLHIRLVETSSGLEEGWFSYHLKWESKYGQFSEEIMLGYVATMSESEARSQALGY